MKFFIITFSFLLSLTSQAYTFEPYKFLNPGLQSRGDLNDTDFNYKVDPALKQDLKTVDVEGVRLTFYKEMIDLFETAKGDKVDPKVRLERTAHSKLKCKASKKNEKTKKLCREIKRPESYVFDQDRKEFKWYQTMNLEGMIRLAGGPLSDYQFPNFLKKKEYLSSMRDIILKIRYKKLRRKLKHYIRKEKDGDIKAELVAALNFLEDLNGRGVAQAKLERKELKEAGQCRKKLSYPSLTDKERELIAMYVGGIYWRMRGGGVWHTGSTTKARLLFLWASYSQIGQLLGKNAGRSVAYAIFSRIFRSWGEWFDMGRGGGGGDKFQDLHGMTKRGHYQVGAGEVDIKHVQTDARSVMQKYGYSSDHIKMAGSMMGPCYFYTWENFYGKDKLKIGYHDINEVPRSSFLVSPTAYGEFCAGGTLALAMAKTFLNGKSCH